MLKAVATIIAGGILTLLPEPVISTALGLTLLMRGVRMLRGGGEEPP